MIAYSLRDLSIVDWQFRAGIVFVFVAVLASSWLWSRRLVRWGTRALCIPVAVAFVGAAINAHFDYFPTLGALLGRRAADQISASDFLSLEHKYLRTFHGRYHYGRNDTTTPGSLPVRGVVLSFSIPATVSGFPARTGQVYLPPVWFENPHPRLPVIELLHGSPGSPDDWTRGGAADLTADTFAQTHNGFAPILVMPDVNGTDWWHDSECVNGPLGNAETYLTVDVRNAVVRAFGAQANGDGWGVAGLSEGGSCALQMGLRHPDFFSVVGDFSGDDHPGASGGLGHLFWGHTQGQLLRAEQAYDPRTILARWHQHDPPAIVFSVGRDDHSFQMKMQQLIAEARRHHIAATLDVFGGGHTFWVWRESFARAMPWMMQHFDTAQAAQPVPDGA